MEIILTNTFFSGKAYIYARWLTFFLFLSLPFTRMLSGLNLVGITLIAWVFLVFHWNRKLIPTSLIYFTVIANFYTILSFFHIFPSIWTTEFEVQAIPQQALFAYSILPLFYLFFTVLTYYLHSEERLYKLLKILLLVVLYNKIIQFVLGGFDFQIFFSLAGLGNTSALAILGFALIIALKEHSNKKHAYMGGFVLLSILSPYAQNIVFALLFF